MKKAFDENVSRSKPRLRLSSLAQAVDEVQAEVTESPTDVSEPEVVAVAPVAPAVAEVLTEQVRTRAEKARAPKPSAAEAMQRALEQPAPPAPVRAAMEPPAVVYEVQTPPAPKPREDDGVRRDRLKQRLKAVRENPRPEPLPATVAEAGVLAVERIAHLQEELGQVKTLNLALTQDLETARRQSERATEEARSRMEEARRLASEMEARAKLLAELEKELSSLEAERDETLLSLQTTRQTLDSAGSEKKLLEAEVARRDQQLADSLAEEERLCDELESARGEAQGLRRAVDTLNSERDTLARQVSELTKERIELLEARKALESVHRALSKAAAR